MSDTKRLVKYLVLGILAVIFQTSFFQELFGPALAPNLLSALCVGLMLKTRYTDAYWVGLVGGFFIDALTGSLLGKTALFLTIFTFSYVELSSFYLTSKFPKWVFIVVAFFFQNAVTYGVFAFTLTSVLQPLFTAALAYLLSVWIPKLHEKITL